ncbi:ferredoxin [Pseudomonas chlororaphis]|uniref:2Fe-2S iron-sulfur cluster-binding protein n=1 Tax=Pseudomonas morbosilactucae TaxID=2938197 RepID=A0ABT0JPP2_9PSED|nr:2Fe-2S iron-sulfur cluster-binding protein [Pseudomonas morbosilactucae]MCK9817903.1 2Fe-2S iron-sulfur cluster-binding protein [Pseudomonas morbosilactucae]ROL70232.1 ferredoxin [Pseudomonas chlororaphis]WEK07770.1 MAG: 2Fe-2S iron-sulfur cluster-binding protein [Pseudomonas sp.]
MPTINVICRDGGQMQVRAPVGISLMEALRDAGVDDVRALCGGCCSCATCHVFVLQGAEHLAPMGSDEADMLDCSLYRRDTSRLACQLNLDASSEGLCVEVAPDE